MRKVTISFIMSVLLAVCIEKLGCHWTDFHEVWHLSTFRKSVQKIQVSLETTGITGTLHEDQCVFLIIPRSVLPRMRNVSDKSCRVNQNIRLRSITFFSKIVPFYYKSAKMYILEPDRLRLTLWCMRIACWIPTAINTHSEYVILITFLLQQWLHERAAMLHYTYIACLLVIEIGSV